MRIFYDSLADGDIAVYLDSKRVGTIVTVAHGYRYFPANFKVGGDTFSNLMDFKRSLEMPDPEEL